MTDIIWIISSSVLILAVIAVRAVFGKKMSAGLRYALWALVLIRLLIPGTVFSSPVSVESAAETAEIVQNYQAIRGVGSISYSPDSSVAGYPRNAYYPPSAQTTAAPFVSSAPIVNEPVSEPRTIVSQATPERFERIQKTLRFRDIAVWVWIAGMAAALLFFVIENLRFMFDLRSRRKRIEADCRLPVYSVDNLPSSCLFFGSIYISADTAADPDALRFVLEHEKAHFRHGDHIWTVLRLAALVLHWYNPLVWWAAVLSRRDGELFADAGALSRLGDDSREDYGLTLIALSARRPVTPPVFSAATTMTNGKRELKQRIKSISKKHKRNFLIAAIVLLITAAAVFFTFTGCKSPAEPGTDPEVKETETPTAEPTAAPTAEPTAEPTPEPSPVPLPSDEWLLNEAWPYAESANSMYALNFSRENAEIVKDDLYGTCTVCFTDGDGLSLKLYFYYDRNGNGWYVRYNEYLPDITVSFEGLDWDWPEMDVPENGLFVTPADLESMGYTPNGTVDDYIAVARWFTGKEAELYLNTSDNSVFRCLEADPGEPAVYAVPLMPNEAYFLNTRLYLRPANLNAFLYAVIETFPGCAGPDSPFPGRVSMMTQTVIKATKGGWLCGFGSPNDGGLCPGWIYPGEDAMSSLVEIAGRILNPKQDDSLESNASWFIRYLYGMNWEEFGRLYTEEQWNTIADRLVAGAVGVEGIPQVYMDKYLMLGCVNNARIEYHAGLAALLNAQKAYDPDAFDKALATLNDSELSDVLTIMESGSNPLSTNVSIYTSGYSHYYWTSTMYLEDGYIQQPWLEGKSPYVYFNLEEDGLKAYGKKIVRSTRTANNDWEVSNTYIDLLATYPREVGVLANQKLVEYANSMIWYGADEDALLIDEGFIGENWFCLVTLDDSMQDLQVHVIFYNDGGNWIEIPGNNGGLYVDGVDYSHGNIGACFPLYGACVVSKDVAYISYYSKFLWDDELGFTKPYVYRTDDGGATWKRLDITLPDYFLPSADDYRICVPLSPFFRGGHGIMLLAGLTDYECAWLESFDSGRTWQFKFESLMNYPVD